jgi:hypothetical protein
MNETEFLESVLINLATKAANANKVLKILDNIPSLSNLTADELNEIIDDCRNILRG